MAFFPVDGNFLDLEGWRLLANSSNITFTEDYPCALYLVLYYSPSSYGPTIMGKTVTQSLQRYQWYNVGSIVSFYKDIYAGDSIYVRGTGHSGDQVGPCMLYVPVE